MSEECGRLRAINSNAGGGEIKTMGPHRLFNEDAKQFDSSVDLGVMYLKIRCLGLHLALRWHPFNKIFLRDVGNIVNKLEVREFLLV